MVCLHCTIAVYHAFTGLFKVLDSKSRLLISEFSGYPCSFFKMLFRLFVDVCSR